MYIFDDEEYLRKIIDLGRHDKKPRKDLVYAEQIVEFISYFFDDMFAREDEIPAEVSAEDARQIFAKKGIANTTMNDIAEASGKGRRTLYTYFKSKDDVYYAVIEGELERLSDKLDEVASKRIPPHDKIIELIYTHLSMIKETVMRNGNLRAEFFRNIWMVEKVRKNFDEDEIELFRKVYTEAKNDGDFDIDNVDLVADITHYCIKGLEVPFIYGRLGHGLTEASSRPLVAKVVYGALGNKLGKGKTDNNTY